MQTGIQPQFIEVQKITAAMVQEAQDLGIENGVAVCFSVYLIDLLGGLSDEEWKSLIGLSLAEMYTHLTDESFPGQAFIYFHRQLLGQAGRFPDPAGRGEQDKGSNYGPIADSKVWEMLRTGLDSGQGRDPRKGELSLRGGLITPTHAMAFSGGSEDQDVRISEVGRKQSIEIAKKEFVDLVTMITEWNLGRSRILAERLWTIWAYYDGFSDQRISADESKQRRQNIFRILNGEASDRSLVDEELRLFDKYMADVAKKESEFEDERLGEHIRKCAEFMKQFLISSIQDSDSLN